ncbi:MAG: SDR family oxidoreductase [Cellvibrionaceae bacterium]|nr:SDR family oxidoreductase [Cellvibrionaceae bacterium]|tara:strand:+ start:2299 stop:3129 length:831 start_codon:yes stop_codon:yes gene_type:complete
MKIQAGQVAVITGAGGGIGKQLAAQLAHRGVNLALVDINPDALEATQQSLSNSSVRITLHALNIGDCEGMKALADDVVEAHGGVNILINNAGITIQKSFETHSIEDWRRVMDVNWWGVIYACKFFLPALKAAGKKDGAHIINLSSMAAFVGLPEQASYCTTKSAVQVLSETLWSEFNDDNIGVTAVHPGCVKTDMIKATMNESDNVELAERHYNMVQRVGVSAEYAAARMLKAIEKNSIRIRIGKDSIMLDLIKRLLPKGILKPMVKVHRQSLTTP